MERKRVLDILHLFYSANIDDMDKDALVTLWADIDKISGATFFSRGLEKDWKSKPGVWEWDFLKNSLGTIKSVQRQFAKGYVEIFDSIFSTKPPDGWLDASEFLSEVIPHTGEALFKFPHMLGAFYSLDAIKTAPVTFNSIVSITPWLEVSLSDDGRKMVRWSKNWRDTARIRVASSPTQVASALVVAFLKAIDGLHPSAFKKCPGCGTYFVQPGKRERRYCTQACGARYLNRLRYKAKKTKGGKEYEQEKKAGRERSKKSYQKKRGKDGS